MSVSKGVVALARRVRVMERKLGDGLEKKVDTMYVRLRLVERMQWWQIGLFVAIIGALVIGLWTMYREDRRETAELRTLILDRGRER